MSTVLILSISSIASIWIKEWFKTKRIEKLKYLDETAIKAIGNYERKSNVRSRLKRVVDSCLRRNDS